MNERVENAPGDQHRRMNAPITSQPQRKLVGRNQCRSARQFPWTAEEDALLGKLCDSEVAANLNRTLPCVRGRRKFLGKTAVGHAPPPCRIQRLSRDYVSRLFATKSDKEILSILGWSRKRVKRHRRQLMSNHKAMLRREWSVEEDRLLGTEPDEVLAKKFGRRVKSVRYRRWMKRIRVKRDWRPEDDKVLGTRTDYQVALLLGRSQSNVWWRRTQLGIPAYAKPRRWTPEEEALLGSKPDRELARLFRRTVTAVAARRSDLGRPKPGTPFNIVRVVTPPRGQGHLDVRANAKRGASYCTWTVQEDALLGQFSDEQVAHKLSYPVERVRRRRRLLGLASNNPKHRHWTKDEIALLGTRPDREVAPLVNRSLENVRCKRLALGIPFRNPRYEIWKPAEVALLGKLADEEVARRTGHSLASVRHARTKRRIFSVDRVAPEWRPDEDALLGTAPDQEIAARLNRTLKAVSHRRVVRGIRRAAPTG